MFGLMVYLVKHGHCDGEVGLRGQLRRADRVFLGGGLTTIKRTLTGHRRSATDKD